MTSQGSGASTAWLRALALLALVAAGETIFFLPFVLARVFRPTLLDVFGLTNVELGAAFAVYGIVAMGAYLVGGPLADRFKAKNLIVVALIATALGGLVMASVPQLGTLKALYAYWGVTTIALFWAPLIRATREWGGELAQGKAFGFLDGGRGLITALTGSLMVALFASRLPEDVDSATMAQRTEALKQIILTLSAMTVAAGVLAFFALHTRGAARVEAKEGISLAGIRHLLAMPTVWLQALIILCAYVGFKATDDFSLYSKDVLGLNEVEAARAVTVSLWMRPIAAVGAGLLADRLGAGRLTLASFVLLLLGSAVLSAGMLGAGLLWPFLISISCASLGIFALRGLYYAIMQEGRVPVAFTGTAVGLVSVIGYTPDIFMGPLMGYLLDGAPGAVGHQRVFAVVAGFAALGLGATFAFLSRARQKPQETLSSQSLV